MSRYNIYLKSTMTALFVAFSYQIASVPALAQDALTLNAGISYIRMDETSKDHPDWMKGAVYSTSDMVLRVFTDIHMLFSHKRIKSTIPDYTTSSVRLRKRVLTHWHGYKPGESCRVITEPIPKDGKPDGNFKFHHFNPAGPRGYLQSIGRDEEGYMQYRIWFVDQIAEAHSN